jgi:hypothetical protein
MNMQNTTEQPERGASLPPASGSARTSICPQCGESVIQPRDSEDYCEECGWPDENRIPQGTINVTYLQLKQMLEQAKSNVEAAPGEDVPDGYYDLSEEQTKVADDCWTKGMEQITNEVLNWAFDQLQAQNNVLGRTKQD